MYNVITRKTEDPTSEFSGLWVNTKSGAMFVWVDKPILVGYGKDGKVVNVDVFKGEFKFEPAVNKQKYHVTYDYQKVPIMVLAQMTSDGYEGSDVEIYFGSLYGIVEACGNFVIVNQVGNVELGSDLEFGCKPLKGSLEVTLYVVGYE